MYQFREQVVAGGLMISTTSTGKPAAMPLGFSRARNYLPVLQPIKFQFLINLRTAKALGVKISDNLLSLADGMYEYFRGPSHQPGFHP